jgi:hypothetical protein
MPKKNKTNKSASDISAGDPPDPDAEGGASGDASEAEIDSTQAIHDLNAQFQTQMLQFQARMQEQMVEMQKSFQEQITRLTARRGSHATLKLSQAEAGPQMPKTTTDYHQPEFAMVDVSEKQADGVSVTLVGTDRELLVIKAQSADREPLIIKAQSAPSYAPHHNMRSPTGWSPIDHPPQVAYEKKQTDVKADAIIDFDRDSPVCPQGDRTLVPFNPRKLEPFLNVRHGLGLVSFVDDILVFDRDSPHKLAEVLKTWLAQGHIVPAPAPPLRLADWCYLNPSFAIDPHKG